MFAWMRECTPCILRTFCIPPPPAWPAAKLVEEKCDFQRSMANNEAKLKENEEDLRRAQREFVDALEKANAAYTHNR